VAELTFRDFAGAVMQGDTAKAATVLQELLALSPDAATAAATHFKGRMSDPSFMPKAMGLRTAVQSGSDADIEALLADCFGLDGDMRGSALVALRTRYPKS
jgi:hypothetical protein